NNACTRAPYGTHPLHSCRHPTHTRIRRFLPSSRLVSSETAAQQVNVVSAVTFSRRDTRTPGVLSVAVLNDIGLPRMLGMPRSRWHGYSESPDRTAGRTADFPCGSSQSRRVALLPALIRNSPCSWHPPC